MLDRSIRSRYWIAVRVALRMAEHPVDPIDHEVRHAVLEDLGLGVDLRPGVAQAGHQERLDETMSPDDLERIACSGRGELDVPVRLPRGTPLRRAAPDD